MNIHNLVLITGRLAADPELRTTQSGISCCQFNVAVNRQYQKGKPQEVDFISVTAWRQTAEFVSRYFRKGNVITVLGSMRNNNYTDQNGVKHYSMNVQAENVAFGLKSSDSNASAGQPSATTSAANQTPDAENQPAEESVQLGDLNGFEEILSDGKVPF